MSETFREGAFRILTSNIQNGDFTGKNVISVPEN